MLPNPSSARRWWLSGALLAALAAATACENGTPGGRHALPVTEPSPAIPAGSTKPAHRVAPLTGQAAESDAITKRPALAVPLVAGRGAIRGLDEADLVFEEITTPNRYLAIFHSREAKRVGPIGETRPADGMVLAVLRPLYAHAGGPRRFVRQLDDHPLTDLGYPSHARLYATSGGRLWLDTTRFFRAAKAPAPPTLLAYTAEPDSLAREKAAPADRIEIAIPDRPTQVWTYEVRTNRWVRERGGPRAAVANLIVQHVRYKQVRSPANAGGSLPSARVFGRGECVAVAYGYGVRCGWRKPGLAAATSYVDPGDFPLRFTPGNSWVILAPPGTTTRVK